MTLALNAKLHLKASLTCSIELHTSRCMQFYGNMMCAYDGCVSISTLVSSLPLWGRANKIDKLLLLP